MLYFILFLILIATWAVVFKTTNYDLVSPVSLFLLGMMLSTGFAVLGTLSWNKTTLSIEAFAVTVLGAASFIGGSFLAKSRVSSGKHFSKKQEIESDYSTPVGKYLIVAAVMVFAIVLRIVETYQLAAEFSINTDSFQSMIKAVRDNTASFQTSDALRLDYGYSFVCRQLSKLVTAVGYVTVVLLAKSAASKAFKKKDLFLLLYIGIVIVYVLLMGGRSSIINMVIAGFIAFVMYKIHWGINKKKFALQAFGVGSALAVLGIVGFYLMGFAIGRAPSSGIVEYITFYFGGGTPTFQALLDEGYNGAEYLGLNTFYNLYGTFYKFGILGTLERSYSIAWFDMGGHGSNIFGPFARYYLDFGFAGVLILSAIAGFAFEKIYQYAVNNMTAVSLIIYVYIAPNIFDMAREEYFFSRLLSFSLPASILLATAVLIFLGTDLRQDWLWLKSKFKREAAE